MLISPCRRSWNSRVLVAVGSTILALVMAEVGVKVFAPAKDPWAVPPKRAIDPFGPNPYIVTFRPFLHAHIPGSVYVQKRGEREVLYAINSRGFRGPEIAARPPEGTRRLLVIGDSIVEGHGVEFDQVFTGALDRMLRPDGWEVVNVAVQGGSPMYYAANLPRYLALYPSAVLLVIYDNDLFDDQQRSVAYPTLPAMPEAMRLAEGGKMSGKPVSHLLALVAKRVRLWSYRRKPSAVGELNARHRAENRMVRPDYKFALEPFTLTEEEFAGLWPVTRDYLNLFAEEMRRRNTALLVARLSGKYRYKYSPDEQHRHADLLDKYVEGWAAEKGMPYLSLKTALDDELTTDVWPPPVLLPEDYHLTSYGHRVVAQALYAWLKEYLRAKKERGGTNGFVPPRLGKIK